MPTSIKIIIAKFPPWWVSIIIIGIIVMIGFAIEAVVQKQTDSRLISTITQGGVVRLYWKSATTEHVGFGGAEVPKTYWFRLKGIDSVGTTWWFNREAKAKSLDEYNNQTAEFIYKYAFITELGEIDYNYRDDSQIQTHFSFVFNQLDMNLL